MRKSVYDQIIDNKNQGKKSVAVLIDPDHHKLANLEATLTIANRQHVDYFFVGGSLIIQDRMDECLRLIRERSSIPAVLFPGNCFQISEYADALLFLSLISGRNPEYLIGKHVEAAPKLHMTSLEIIPTGYMIIDGQNSNTAAYISQTMPIPSDKVEIAVATSLAAELLGFKLLYLDAGSGAQKAVNPEMISRVSALIKIPIITGGGIKSGSQAISLFKAGADILVIGNAIEKDPSLIVELTGVAREYNFANQKDA
ncbi:MAG: geranylgeranylglyceryl/heptaprenylglyceryl phosphate synthase [Saprospiraceae bacterium]|nr:geranylgeranylglyceryl/heptaprenylglyceryl phosphate synthase [Saprospiraceae bacterium]HMW37977.1 geranylgeranylglyceryl/heptaprenylglyceryl phosphate synthase [Saprospiraceae bacterium]HMX87651.1 geranylgeranylglyceryl/heptaprenylglyceryl phosphate synthase [Saprospiraceae bacterium]HMZ39466.1 geranylgeranylglyceryl/heptaprenylglyceryl phosphate synthase [Saprospiraceae bacterium]HNA63252.1 geranylgeranylglyceryl/heptaprenylglyceryl phosphate synthase [Saprospiraceae bacterium]